MKIGVLSIGDELLRGATVNTNLAFIGQELAIISEFPVMEMAVKDDTDSINDALDVLFRKCELVISTGGLGPTSDDVTKTTVSGYFGLKMKEDPVTAENIRAYWSARRFGKMPPQVMNQALVPESAVILANRTGTAPGLIISKNAKTVIMLPGPPNEMQPMLKEFVISYVNKNSKDKTYTEIIYLTGIPESSVEQKAAPIVEKHSGVGIAYCASPEAMKVFLSGKNRRELAITASKVRKALRENAMLPGCRTIVEEVSALLRKKKKKLVTAESCTGGLIASVITEEPGSSEIFAGSVVAYSNELKTGLLGVGEETLTKHGAVSEECAVEMVVKICQRLREGAGIAVTGIAGPGGGSPEKPVGLVYIATKFGKKIDVRKLTFKGNRETIRKRTVASALNQLRKQLRS